MKTREKKERGMNIFYHAPLFFIDTHILFVLMWFR